MRKSIIVAASQSGVIGKDGKLPWHLPSDLKRFKALTMGHTLIMGRKTFESIGKPLPGRTTLVLTRQTAEMCSFYPEGVHCARSLDEAMDAAFAAGENEVFICGGGEVYREALPLVDRVYLTVVERDFEGDTRFKFVFDGSALEFFNGVQWRRVAQEHGNAELVALGMVLPHRFEIWDRVR
jgi:dihydrofolate reductase